MSSQKGNVSRSRGQKHQNSTAFKNDKYGATAQVKKAKSKIHDGLCQRCKDVLEWKVKYSKYKSLTQPKKCVKCSQKTVKDAYHIVCKPCSLHLEICCKCGKKEDIVIPVNSQLDNEPEEEDKQMKKTPRGQRKDLDSDDDFDFGDDDDDIDDLDGEDDEDFVNGSKGKTSHGKGKKDLDGDGNDAKKRQNNSTVLPDVSNVHLKE